MTAFEKSGHSGLGRKSR